MVLLVFIGINPQGYYREHSYGDADAESCFERLSQLVQQGWHMISVSYFDMYSTSATDLPALAFDGKPMKEPLRQLQLEWELIMATA